MADGLKAMPMAPKPRSDMDNDEGFVEVKRQKNKKKAGPNRNVSGINLSKCKPNVQYRPVSRQGKDNDDASKTAANGQKKGSLDFKNSFDTLMEKDNNLEEGGNEEEKSKDQGSFWERFKASKEASSSKPKSDYDDDSDEDEVYFPQEEYTSGMDGGFSLDEEDLDGFDGYEA
ncbi:hypothetical protein Tco_0662969 [Tanacetum coccineum]